jgi:hypothetical protein
MRIGYTEFSFGYAFTENLIRSSATGPKKAPVFPNLMQEAHKGYDVRIDLPGVPLFFQYKLPELTKPDDGDQRGAPIQTTAIGRKLLERSAPAWHRAQARAKKMLGSNWVDLLFATLKGH